MKKRNSILFLLILLSSSIHAFYLPGLGPNLFGRYPIQDSKYKTEVDVFVNRLDSVESVLPYEYSYFDFCAATDERSPVENLGQVLFGERIRPSPYKFDFLKNDDCHLVCRKKFTSGDTNQQKMLKRLMKGMILNYQQHWIIDNMPVTLCYKNNENQEFCSRSFPIGCYVTKSGQSKISCNIRGGKNDTFNIFNHLDFEITYHSGEGETWGSAFGEDGGRIIAAKVQVKSFNSDKCDRSAEPLMFQSTTKDLEIPFTYSVKYVKNNDIRWASRSDYILKSLLPTRIQWFSILNSLIMMLSFSGMVAMILLRTLDKDIAWYNQMVDAHDEPVNMRWKLVHGDVFRPPHKGMLLSVLIGNGVQIAIMSLITLIFACLGFLSPASPGILMTCAIFSYVLSGTPAGYTSARLYKMFGGEKWKKNALLTAVACPSVIFGIFLVLNTVHWANGSSAAIPFTTFLALLALWFCVSTPLVFLGAYLGFRQPISENPVRTNQIPRQIPKQTLYNKPIPGILMGGIVSFSCIGVQLFHISNSIWAHQYYTSFELSLLVYIIFKIICSEITILLCYFHLCAEDYHWWWRSFLTSGFTAVYFFFHSVYYFSIQLEISDVASIFLYFGYTLMLTFILFLFTGTVGFLACLWFVRKIYSTIKINCMDDVALIDLSE